jgi:hypothetical protein
MLLYRSVCALGLLLCCAVLCCCLIGCPCGCVSVVSCLFQSELCENQDGGGYAYLLMQTIAACGFFRPIVPPPLASPPLPDLPADDKRWAAGLDLITTECQRWHVSVEERRRVSMQSSVTEAVGAAVAAANAASDSRWAAEVSVCVHHCWLYAGLQWL